MPPASPADLAPPSHAPHRIRDKLARDVRVEHERPVEPFCFRLVTRSLHELAELTIRHRIRVHVERIENHFPDRPFAIGGESFFRFSPPHAPPPRDFSHPPCRSSLSPPPSLRPPRPYPP